MTSIKDFTLDVTNLNFTGQNLSRPESVLAEKDGTLWTSDNRGGVTRIDPDGTETTLGDIPEDPNGLAMDTQGNLYIANIGDGKIYKMSKDGKTEVILDQINGEPLGAANYVFIDSQDRLWIAISTRTLPWFPAAASPRPDGYVILLDENGPRIVLDGILFTNEVRLNADESYLYVAETMGCRIVKHKVNDDGTLGPRESVGPESLGDTAYVDGFTFDAEGNIWVTTILHNGLVVITPEGDVHTVFEERNEAALANAKHKVDEGTLTPEDMFACVGQHVQFPVSLTFGGPDLKTAYMGSLAMPKLITFESPVPGLPMRHWDK